MRLSQGQSITADHFVLAAGAWSGRLAGLPPLPVAPRKGQMIEVQLAAGGVLPCVVRTPELYLVPRGDGRVAIGATVEHAGFDRQSMRRRASGCGRRQARCGRPCLGAE